MDMLGLDFAAYWPWFAGTIGFVASVIGIYEFIRRVTMKKSVHVPEYSGSLNENCVHFIYEHQKSIFKLELQLSESQSKEISSAIHGGNDNGVVWLGIAHDECGTEIGFHGNDNEIHWNTRFWDAVHTDGYFKVHSIQGPYQGWMSVLLRGVGFEHIPA